MSDAVLYAKDVWKAWRGHDVLRGADLELRRGQVTAILGPSGAGKSTLLRAIAGLDSIDRGHIQAGDRTLSSARVHEPPEKRGIGLVFQDYALFPHMSALENVMFGLSGLPPKRRRERAQAMLEAVQLAHKAKSYPHALSGGEQQRIALARALAPSPELVLMDEAFSGLDARLRDELRATTLSALRDADAAVLIVTHDADEAFALADTLALMCDGKVIQSGAPADVYASPNSLRAARLTGPVNVWRGIVTEGQMQTPFGQINAPDLAEGVSALALIRPEAVTLIQDEKGPGKIETVRPSGADHVIAFTLPSADAPWRARVTGACDLTPGDTVALDVETSRGRVVSD